MNIRAVLFDGYGTLFSGGMDKLYKVCEKICDDHGVDLDGRGFLGKWDKYFFPLIRNGAFIPFREAHYRSLTTVFGELGINAKPNGYVERIFELLGQVDLYDDVEPALGKLDGFPHGVVSNADSDHLHNALSRNGLSFNLVVSSESARVYKPSAEIFTPALETLNVSPEETLYVGDSQEDDSVAASSGGLQMAWLNREGESRKKGIPDPDFVIQSLSELEEVMAHRV